MAATGKYAAQLLNLDSHNLRPPTVVRGGDLVGRKKLCRAIVYGRGRKFGASHEEDDARALGPGATAELVRLAEVRSGDRALLRHMPARDPHAGKKPQSSHHVIPLFQWERAGVVGA